MTISTRRSAACLRRHVPSRRGGDVARGPWRGVVTRDNGFRHFTLRGSARASEGYRSHPAA
ncbi:hypothetical protein [Teichococcus oryzae]|uniref:Uncharacterized protein n=1 Tax=Teichococcus oryzae TaxID=1608942 RepID=A0A5B2TFL1_9PROT|nr:hypothetical protein [Pseudoroseomonas oryzae]KAA2213286.1 hypothetical protein F0Q34_11740 [Pseudoroseomonas oryzae]